MGWPDFHVVDLAVEGLVQSIHELCHATKPPPQIREKNSLSRRCTEVRLDTICASHLSGMASRPARRRSADSSFACLPSIGILTRGLKRRKAGRGRKIC